MASPNNGKVSTVKPAIRERKASRLLEKGMTWKRSAENDQGGKKNNVLGGTPFPSRRTKIKEENSKPKEKRGPGQKSKSKQQTGGKR